MKLAKLTEIISCNIMLKKIMKKIGCYLIALWEVSEALILLCGGHHFVLREEIERFNISKIFLFSIFIKMKRNW